jgi:hypothetical protein
MDAGLPGLQPQTTPPAVRGTETGTGELKLQGAEPGDGTSRLGSGGKAGGSGWRNCAAELNPMLPTLQPPTTAPPARLNQVRQAARAGPALARAAPARGHELRCPPQRPLPILATGSDENLRSDWRHRHGQDDRSGVAGPTRHCRV